MTVTAALAPPYNLEAEQAVLGAALLSQNFLRPLIVEERLRPEHFYRDRHRLIWAAMVAMSDAEQHVDVLTLVAHLKAAGDLEAAGGKGAVDELTGGVPGLGGFLDYARIVIEHWRWRQRLTSTYEQQAAVQTTDEAAFEAALSTAASLVVLAAEESFVEPEDLAAHMWRLLEGEPDEGLPLPAELSGLRRMLRLRAGQVTVLGGWSHHGKSIVAQMIADTVGWKGLRAVTWTNEDTAEEIAARHLQRVTGVPAQTIADRKLTPGQMSRIVPELGRLPFGIQPCYGWDAKQIGRHIRQVRPALAVVDHFHNLPGVGNTEGADEAMQALVAAAGQAACHLIVVAQLNLSRNQFVVRPAPVGRDLRGTGQLYNLAHIVLLVYRQEEELKDVTGRLLGRPVQLEEGHLDVAKNKSGGKLGAIAVNFDAKHVRFVQQASNAEGSA